MKPSLFTDLPPQKIEYSAEFEEFWKAYPRKEAKRDAYRAWNKNHCAAFLGVILAAIAAQKRTEQWGKRHIYPHPATWLNAARWEDEVQVRRTETREEYATRVKREREDADAKAPALSMTDLRAAAKGLFRKVQGA